MRFPGRGKGLMNRDRITKQVRGFLYFRAQEEILQLVNLDTISVHFSLCNQPICSSLRISRARPAAGRRLSGTVLIPVCQDHSRQAQNKAQLLSLLGWGSPQGAANDPSQQQDPAQEKPLLLWGEGGFSKGLGTVQRDRCDMQISSAFQALPAHPSKALPRAGKGGLCSAARLQSLAHPMGC